VVEISSSVHITLSVDNNCRNESISASLPNCAQEGVPNHNQTHILECIYGVQILFFPHCNLKIYMTITDKNYCLILINIIQITLHSFTNSSITKADF
jgi:hypothetical protein